MSRHKAAAHFGVAVTTGGGWLARLRPPGRVAGGHKPRTVSGEHRDWLIERCRTRDFTLRGLVAELAERGLTVDYHSVWDFVHAEKLSYKKNRSRQRTGSPGHCTPQGAMAPLSDAD